MSSLQELHLTSSLIDQIYKAGYIENLEECNYDTNEYIILKSMETNASAIASWTKDKRIKRINNVDSLTYTKIKPLDSMQSALADSFFNKDILLNIAIGSAGTGKTTLALAYALQAFQENDRPIILTKPAIMVGSGKAFGPVPGDFAEKYDPYLASYMMVFEKILGKRSHSYLDMMRKNNKIQFIPIELVRGCTFENCTLIIDEAQNLLWHEINTVCSRLGENAKIILLGDLEQIDIPKKYDQIGLYQLMTSKTFRDSEITSLVKLETQYRSQIADLLIRINKEINEGTNNSKDRTRA